MSRFTLSETECCDVMVGLLKAQEANPDDPFVPRWTRLWLSMQVFLQEQEDRASDVVELDS